MKKVLLFSAVLLLITACSEKPKEYPNVVTNQLATELTWGMNYSEVKNILVEDYKLDFLNEVEQDDRNKNSKVYEFSGGKFNDVETNHWVVAFENDSLLFISMKLGNQNAQENEVIANKLSEVFNSELVPDTVEIPFKKQWFAKRDGITKNVISLTMLVDDKLQNTGGLGLHIRKPMANE